MYPVSSFVLRCLLQLLDEESRYVSPKEHKLFLYYFDDRFPNHDEDHFRYWRDEDTRQPIPEQRLSDIREYGRLVSKLQANNYFDYIESQYRSGRKGRDRKGPKLLK